MNFKSILKRVSRFVVVGAAIKREANAVQRRSIRFNQSSNSIRRLMTLLCIDALMCVENNRNTQYASLIAYSISRSFSVRKPRFLFDFDGHYDNYA